jgi:hypothetical protein
MREGGVYEISRASFQPLFAGAAALRTHRCLPPTENGETVMLFRPAREHSRGDL